MLLTPNLLTTFGLLAWRTLDMTRGRRPPAVWFAELGHALTITVTDGRSWVEYRQPGEFNFLRFSLPWSAVLELGDANGCPRPDAGRTPSLRIMGSTV